MYEHTLIITTSDNGKHPAPFGCCFGLCSRGRGCWAVEAPLGLSDSSDGVRWAACGFVVLVCGLSWLASASECCCGCMRTPRAAPKPRRP